jgi:hypothetical protein
MKKIFNDCVQRLNGQASYLRRRDRDRRRLSHPLFPSLVFRRNFDDDHDEDTESERINNPAL